VVGVCSGAFLLAAAGLLDGRRATTHWARAARLAAEHPGVEVDADPIWVRDGHVWTSAGVTAGIDVSLALVEDDHGVEVAETCARWLVMFLRRPGTQSQFAAPVWRDRAHDGPIRRAQELIEGDPAGDHRLGVLARRVALSERHFLRRFTAELGTTPARYVADVRVDAARRELEDGTDSVAAIAARVGFGTAESMRRTFVRHLGTPPDDYRRRFTHRKDHAS
jgi:transcriptional regulator GlxA family with amidase domain